MSTVKIPIANQATLEQTLATVQNTYDVSEETRGLSVEILEILRNLDPGGGAQSKYFQGTAAAAITAGRAVIGLKPFGWQDWLLSATPTVYFGMNTGSYYFYSGAYTHDGAFVGIGTGTSPYLELRSANGATLGNYASLATSPGASVKGVEFTPDDLCVCAALSATPFIATYKRTSKTSTSWTKVANPTTLPTGAANCVDISPDGKYCAIGHATTPFITIYQIASDYSLTKLANPTVLPTAEVKSVRFSPDGSKLWIGYTASPYIMAVNTSDWTQVSGVPALPYGAATGMRFDASGAYLVIATTGPSIVVAIKCVGNTYTLLNQTVGGAISGNGGTVAVSADGTIITASSSSNYLYKCKISSIDTIQWLGQINIGTTGSGSFYFAVFSPDNNHLILGGIAAPGQMSVRLFSRFDADTIIPETYSDSSLSQILDKLQFMNGIGFSIGGYSAGDTAMGESAF